MKIPLFLVLLLAWAPSARPSTVDRLMVPSAAMHKDVPVNVVLPAGYQPAAADRFPVVYVLHGAGDNDWTWLNATAIAALAEQDGMVLVCPSAELSWYFDSPEVPASQYETFISRELVDYVDAHYRTRADRLHRAFLGNSMGGHGALFLGIRHRDRFATAVSISGGVDFRSFPPATTAGWNLDKLLGPAKDQAARWNDLCVVNLAKGLKDGDLAISLDCGVYDFFLPGNRALHQELLDQKVSHDYAERPGYHGWPYWANAIPFQMVYLSARFKQAGDQDPPRP